MVDRDFASLLFVNGKNFDSYKLRFTTMVSRYLDGVNYVRLYKTGNHLIVEPLTQDWKAEGSKAAFPVCRESKTGAVMIQLTDLVHNERFLRKELFGKRYKVRKDKKGRLYVCLNEEVDR